MLVITWRFAWDSVHQVCLLVDWRIWYKMSQPSIVSTLGFMVHWYVWGSILWCQWGVLGPSSQALLSLFASHMTFCLCQLSNRSKCELLKDQVEWRWQAFCFLSSQICPHNPWIWQKDVCYTARPYSTLLVTMATCNDQSGQGVHVDGPVIYSIETNVSPQ